MKKNAVASSLIVTALLANLGLGRAIAQVAEHDHEHKGAVSQPTEKKAKSATNKSAGKSHKAAGGEGMMDMKSMCDMHRQMMSSGSPEDREAMAAKETKGMTAEQKQQHMKMMDEKCK